MLYKGYYTDVEWSPEDKCFYGKIENVFPEDLVSWEAEKYSDCEAAYREAVDYYIEYKAKIAKIAKEKEAK